MFSLLVLLHSHLMMWRFGLAWNWMGRVYEIARCIVERLWENLEAEIRFFSSMAIFSFFFARGCVNGIISSKKIVDFQYIIWLYLNDGRCMEMCECVYSQWVLLLFDFRRTEVTICVNMPFFPFPMRLCVPHQRQPAHNGSVVWNSTRYKLESKQCVGAGAGKISPSGLKMQTHANHITLFYYHFYTVLLYIFV